MNYYKAKFSVTATQWKTHGDHPNVLPWNSTTGAICPRCVVDDIHTLEFHHGLIRIGGKFHKVCPEDWIVKYPDNHIEVLHPDEFNTLFERK